MSIMTMRSSSSMLSAWMPAALSKWVFENVQWTAFSQVCWAAIVPFLACPWKEGVLVLCSWCLHITVFILVVQPCSVVCCDQDVISRYCLDVSISRRSRDVVSKCLGLVSVLWKHGKVSVSISSRTENQMSPSRTIGSRLLANMHSFLLHCKIACIVLNAGRL